MSWLDHHEASERWAAEGDLLTRRGRSEEARVAYAKAAEAEMDALSDVDLALDRTYGITAVSAASLHYLAGDHAEAQRVAHLHLLRPELPPFAVGDLQELLQVIWSGSTQESAAGLILPSELDVSIAGGRTNLGLAPLDLVTSVADNLRSILIRSAELTNGLEYRQRGRPSSYISDRYQPLMVQKEAASFHFAIRLVQSEPNRFRSYPDVESDQVVARARDILWQAIHSPAYGLKELVPDPQYRKHFLGLALQLAPSDHERRLETVEIRSDRDDRAIVMDRHSRRSLRLALQSVRDGQDQLIRLQGTMTGLSFVHDWIEVTHQGRTQRIYGFPIDGDHSLEDWILEEVVVFAERGTTGRLQYRDSWLVDDRDA